MVIGRQSIVRSGGAHTKQNLSLRSAGEARPACELWNKQWDAAVDLVAAVRGNGHGCWHMRPLGRGCLAGAQAGLAAWKTPLYLPRCACAGRRGQTWRLGACHWPCADGNAQLSSVSGLRCHCTRQWLASNGPCPLEVLVKHQWGHPASHVLQPAGPRAAEGGAVEAIPPNPRGFRQRPVVPIFAATWQQRTRWTAVARRLHGSLDGRRARWPSARQPMPLLRPPLPLTNSFRLVAVPRRHTPHHPHLQAAAARLRVR